MIGHSRAMGTDPATRAVHPRHGTHDPTTGSPARRPGSIRRTTTIDMLRPEGNDGPLVMLGRGRDLLTLAGGASRVVDTAAIDAEVAFTDDRRLTTMTTSPRVPGLRDLIGHRVGAGFRSRVDNAAPDLGDSGSLLYQMLDDLPGASLVSGHAFISARAEPMAQMSREHASVDLCAGWATDATIMVEIDEHGRVPGVTGPAAPPLASEDDLDSWHELGPLHIHAMRRARRIDVWRSEVDRLSVTGIFRDSYVEADGVETALHEYAIDVTVDTVTMTAIESTATPHALPWVECPRAAESATRIVGQRLSPLRLAVRRDFTGISTCTHLNDQLRSLADVPALAAHLPSS
jgi:hypothetical protein